MEQETLFTTSKWQILQKIATTPMSPLQLSARLNSTIANISQQIRLLEVAGLLDKEKISTRESGKPRMLFRVKEDFAYIILVSKEGAKKKLVKADKQTRLILNSILAEDNAARRIAMSIYNALGSELEEIEGLAFIPSKREFLLCLKQGKSSSRGIHEAERTAKAHNTTLRRISEKEFVSHIKSLKETERREAVFLLLTETISEKLREEV